MTTWRSFVNVDTLFDLLVRRFYIQPPDGLTQVELEKWEMLKQYPIQMR
jgi:son of sevenless